MSATIRFIVEASFVLQEMVGVSVYKKVQKHLGESTHPIGNPRLMHIRMTPSSGTNGTT